MLCEAANSAPSSPSPSPAVDGDLSSGVASPAPPVVASNGPPEPTGTGTGTGVGTPSRGSRWAAAARRAHAVRGGTALATARHAPEDQALCTSCHATTPPSTSASLCQPICLRSLFGWQVVYKNQPPGAADPAPAPPTPGTGAGAGLGSGSVLGATLQPWQQLLQQRPVLTMMEQNIAAIASGIGRILRLLRLAARVPCKVCTQNQAAAVMPLWRPVRALSMLISCRPLPTGGNCDEACAAAKQKLWRAGEAQGTIRALQSTALLTCLCLAVYCTPDAQLQSASIAPHSPACPAPSASQFAAVFGLCFNALAERPPPPAALFDPSRNACVPSPAAVFGLYFHALAEHAHHRRHPDEPSLTHAWLQRMQDFLPGVSACPFVAWLFPGCPSRPKLVQLFSSAAGMAGGGAHSL